MQLVNVMNANYAIYRIVFCMEILLMMILYIVYVKNINIIKPIAIHTDRGEN